MKKNTIKAFTLVEMLIVIVIIGILIASLMPRMQSAQGRARDVARKNDLSQIQTAIITAQQDKWEWPELGSATDVTDISKARGGLAVDWALVTDLQNAGMTQVPTDPNGTNVVTGLKWWTSLTAWKYGYMVTTRNSVKDWGFVLMAKTEVEGSSNWVVCGVGDTCKWEKSDDTGKLTHCWVFSAGVDLKNVKTCSKFEKNDWGSDDKWCQMASSTTDDTCYYTDEWQLAYILVY